MRELTDDFTEAAAGGQHQVGKAGTVFAEVTEVTGTPSLQLELLMPGEDTNTWIPIGSPGTAVGQVSVESLSGNLPPNAHVRWNVTGTFTSCSARLVLDDVEVSVL